MEDLLPESVDVIVLGTGLPESMLAAASSRAGLSVLTIDKNPFYGSSWTSFNFDGLKNWATNKDDTKKKEYTANFLIEDGEIFLPTNQEFNNDGIDNIKFETFNTKESDELEKISRKFSIDLNPKLLLSTGPMVSILCDSEVSKYVEFVNADRLLCLTDITNDEVSYEQFISNVPCSKSDIFKSNSLTMIEKRIMMKFLTEVLKWHFHRDEHEWKESMNDNFIDFLRKQKIGDSLIKYILDIIAILRKGYETYECLDAIASFLTSIGRFGNSPFLYPIYGVGELPQGFSRLSAVYGGIFCLDKRIDGIIVKNDKITGIVAEGQKITCKTLISNSGYLPENYLSKNIINNKIERLIIISNKSIKSDCDDAKVAVLNLASLNNDVKCCLIETGFHGQTAPKGYYVTHITSEKFSDDFISNLDKLFTKSEEGEISSSILMKTKFSIHKLDECIDYNVLPMNLYVTPTTDSDLDFKSIISQCKQLFNKIFPEFDFLPEKLISSNNDNEEECSEAMSLLEEDKVPLGIMDDEELRLALEAQKQWDIKNSKSSGNPWKINTLNDSSKLTDIMSEEVLKKLNVEEKPKETLSNISIDIQSCDDDIDPDLKLALELQKQFDMEINEENNSDYQEAIKLQKLFDEEIAQVYNKDSSLDINEAKKIQHQWDLEVLKKDADDKSEISFGMARYKYSHDDEIDCEVPIEELNDEEDEIELSWTKKYEKKDNIIADIDNNQSGILNVSKHNVEVTKIKNADKTMNFAIGMNVGDCSEEKISSKVFNKLRQYSKDEIKRNFRIKDKAEKSTYEQGMDEDTRLIIFKVIQKDEMDSVEGIIASGKESIVLHGKKEEKNFAIKVYKKTLTEFKNRNEYVKDDFRFKNPGHILTVWAEKEFLNLKRLKKAEINAPEPLYLKKNVMIMTMIGGKNPALKLKDITFEDDESKTDAYIQVEDILLDMYKKCKLVHGDLSEFNLLYHNNNVYVIDVSQAMDLSHPRSLHFLLRDLENVLAFFNKIETPNLPTLGALFEKITDIPIDEEKNVHVQVEQFEADNRNIHLRENKSKPSNVELQGMEDEE
uniref:non-specific serine/threonine protein kinase n=1 Tax=Parastrongyloides trichosuri TaxID=131310 RepID=A0A0N4Z9B9_PARTI